MCWAKVIRRVSVWRSARHLDASQEPRRPKPHSNRRKAAMQSLEALTREASALASNPMNESPIVFAMTPAEGEVSRIMQICNACRYCEGFCAVFPAMTHRLEFGRADVHFL